MVSSALIQRVTPRAQRLGSRGEVDKASFDPVNSCCGGNRKILTPFSANCTGRLPAQLWHDKSLRPDVNQRFVARRTRRLLMILRWHNSNNDVTNVVSSDPLDPMPIAALCPSRIACIGDCPYAEPLSSALSTSFSSRASFFGDRDRQWRAMSPT